VHLALQAKQGALAAFTEFVISFQYADFPLQADDNLLY
jgi:hypothetical protein